MAPDSDGVAAGYRLWAPWRYAYLRSTVAGAQPQCIFCFGQLHESERRAHLVLYESDRAAVMMNLYPYNNGHLMVAPRRHCASPELLQPEERHEIDRLIVKSIEILREQLRPAGFNLGANLGRVAGAGFAEHMHWHVVPRWDGDNNFMPVLASTRVLSQSLRDSYLRLRPLFKATKPNLC